jgi:predicted esterase
MAVEFKTIPIVKQLRYTRSSDQEGQHLIIALHGYGQLIEFFSKKFDGISSDITVVCPEGTHRFYLEGTSGRVGASWMTREWREQDILENNLLLDQLLEKVVSEIKPKTITVLGFSQGVATAARWIANTSVKIDRFIAWAGVFPPDIAVPDFNHFPAKRVAVVGLQDPYLKLEQYNQFRAEYEKLNFEIVEFEGKHELVPALLKEILSHD